MKRYKKYIPLNKMIRPHGALSQRNKAITRISRNPKA